MIYQNTISEFILKISSKLLLVFLLSTLAFMPLAPAFAASALVLNNYDIELNSSNAVTQLEGLSENIHNLFPQSDGPTLQNIYAFQSSYSLTELQSLLSGNYVYLQPQAKLEDTATNETLATGTPVTVNDPGFTSNAQDIDKQWGLAKAGFDIAWNETTGSPSNTVAVIDTGIDETHVDLKSVNFVPGYDFVNNKGITDGTNSDDNGHGTLIAGVLGAQANNGQGIVGTNWQISLMPIKALNAAGQGNGDTVAQAIVWAADHGAQFINLSLGGQGFVGDNTLSDSVTYAFDRGVLIVAAAGNDTSQTGLDLDTNPEYPVCDKNNYNMVIGVTATDQNDLKPNFANYGKACIDVAAPGQRILSTINFDPVSHNPSPNSYAYASGTSMAVAFVVGEATLIRSLYPSATNIQIRDRIIASSDPIDQYNTNDCGGQSCAGLLGAGRIDVPAALASGINESFSEDQLIQDSSTGQNYVILGGQKRPVSSFVYTQLLPGQNPTVVDSSQLTDYPTGPYLSPKDGTLVKYANSPTVYVMQDEQKLPVTGQIFQLMNFSYSNVNTLTDVELNSWITGKFLPPPDGTLMRGQKGRTVYWVVSQVLHPVNANYYNQRGLSMFPLLIVPDSDIAGYPAGEPYIQ